MTAMVGTKWLIKLTMSSPKISIINNNRCRFFAMDRIIPHQNYSFILKNRLWFLRPARLVILNMTILRFSILKIMINERDYWS